MKIEIVKYYDNFTGGYRYKLCKYQRIFFGAIKIRFKVLGSFGFADYDLAKKWSKHYNIELPE